MHQKMTAATAILALCLSVQAHAESKQSAIQDTPAATTQKTTAPTTTTPQKPTVKQFEDPLFKSPQKGNTTKQFDDPLWKSGQTNK